MRFRNNKRTASERDNLFQNFSDMGVTVFRQPPHFFNRVLKNLGH